MAEKKENSLQVGDRIFDKVHKREGTIIASVEAPSDGHHQAFFTCRIDCDCETAYGSGTPKGGHKKGCSGTYREVHLSKEQYEAA